MVAEKTEPLRVISELSALGYELEVTTRVEVSRHKVGEQHVNYADKLRVTGVAPVPEEKRAAIKEMRDEIMAAVIVMNPPIPWVWTIVTRYLEGSVVRVRRRGWKGPYKVSLTMLSAQVASFMGLDPVRDGQRLRPVIEETLKREEKPRDPEEATTQRGAEARCGQAGEAPRPLVRQGGSRRRRDAGSAWHR
jgi:hypothetical protein